MYSALGISSDSYVGLLLDFWEVWIERLLVVVIENTGLPVVLLGNWDEGSDFLGGHDAGHALLGLGETRSGHITEVLLSRLVGVFLWLNGEVVDGLVPRVETPIGALASSLLYPFISSSVVKCFSPGGTLAEEVPVGVSIKHDRTADGPEDPTHLPDHPSVGLTHVVLNMENHCCYYFI